MSFESPELASAPVSPLPTRRSNRQLTAQAPSVSAADAAPLTRRSARALAATAAQPAEPIVEPAVAVEPLVAEEPVVAEEPAVAEEPVLELIEVAPTADSDIEDTAEFELFEPAAFTSEPVAESLATETPSASVADEFERAARLFSFTGETAIQAPAAASASAASEPAAAELVSHVATGRKARARRVRVPGSSFKRMAAASISVTAIGIVGLMTVGMTTPAEAVAAPASTSSTATRLAGDVLDDSSGEIQAYVAPAQVQNVDLVRSETYTTGTLVDLAGTAGISNYSSSVFTNNSSCAIQWPFATGVTMSYGFGMRSGRMHEGVDFTPGDGAHIQAIADGTVRISTDSGGEYGVTIVIDHVVDGQLVSSRYGHMQYGSRQVQVGDHVSVGEYIGRTGNTGRSFGAHTHVEILQNGTTPIDPLPWLRAHATC